MTRVEGHAVGAVEDQAATYSAVVDEDHRRPVRPHHRPHSFENRPRRLGRLGVRTAERAAELVELLERAKALVQSEVAAVHEHDERPDERQRQDGPGVPPCGVKDDEGEPDAGDENQAVSADVEVAPLSGLTIEAHHAGNGEL